MTIVAEGLDYAWGRPSINAIKLGGRTFIVRYLSRDTTGKTLSLTEASQMTNAGIWLACVFEDAAGRTSGGRAAGIADATYASSLALKVGMPPDRPIYFACDTEIITTAQMTKVMEYIGGVASVIGLARTGLYGQYTVIKRAFDDRLITFGWQTYAWSGGRWDSRAQLQQYENEVMIDKVSCDLVRATALDYGQWMIGKGPDMTISKTDADVIALAVLTRDDVIKSIAKTITDVQTTLLSVAAGGYPAAEVSEIVNGVVGALNAPGLVDAIVAGVNTRITPEIDYDLLAGKVADLIAERMRS